MFICVYNRSVWKSQRENSFKAGKRRKKKSSSFSSIDDDDKVQILGWIFLLSIATAFRIKNEKTKRNELIKNDDDDDWAVKQINKATEKNWF